MSYKVKGLGGRKGRRRCRLYRGKARKKRRIFPRNRERRRLDSTVHDRRGRREESAMSIRLSSDGIPRRIDGTKIGKNWHVIAWLGGAEAAASPLSVCGWRNWHIRRGRGCRDDAALLTSSPVQKCYFSRRHPPGASHPPPPLPLPVHSSIISSSSSARNRSFSPRPRRRQRVHQKQCRGRRGGERTEVGGSDLTKRCNLPFTPQNRT